MDPAQQMKDRIARIDPIRVLIVAVLLVVAVGVWSVVRSRVVAPLDAMVTESHCTDYGEEIGREMIGYERSNRFGLVDRSEGYCLFGEGSEGEAPITLTIADTSPGGLYQGAKWIGIVIQLGAVSLFLRATIDPALELYGWARSLLR